MGGCFGSQRREQRAASAPTDAAEHASAQPAQAAPSSSALTAVSSTADDGIVVPAGEEPRRRTRNRAGIVYFRRVSHKLFVNTIFTRLLVHETIGWRLISPTIADSPPSVDSPSGIDSSTNGGGGAGSTRLRQERTRWRAHEAVTESQLRRKREVFWETAPAYEGRQEIWDALRAAAHAYEAQDYAMAQAIIDGAAIQLGPDGSLHEAWDELGNQYRIPLYCLAAPLNLRPDPSSSITSSSTTDQGTPTHSAASAAAATGPASAPAHPPIPSSKTSEKMIKSDSAPSQEAVLVRPLIVKLRFHHYPAKGRPSLVPQKVTCILRKFNLKLENVTYVVIFVIFKYNRLHTDVNYNKRVCFAIRHLSFISNS